MKSTYLLTFLLTSAPLFAADEKKPEAGEHKHEAGKKHDHEEKKVDVKIPDTADALWMEIDKQHKSLGALVTAKKAEDLHVTAETLEALVAAVPAKHADLAADKKKRVEGQAKNIARVLDALHEEGEEGHWDDAAKKLTQVDAALKIVKAQVGK